jgi:hypothetical protein
LILYLLALLLPLRLRICCCNCNRLPTRLARHFDEELAQPLGGLGHYLAHQAAGIPREGAVLLKGFQQGGQAPHQLRQGSCRWA